MSYRLIDANDLNGKISYEDYEIVLNAPCIYADLPNGLDNQHHYIVGDSVIEDIKAEMGQVTDRELLNYWHKCDKFIEIIDKHLGKGQE